MTRKVACFAFALVALVPLAANAPGDGEGIKGIWAAQSISVGGQPVPDDPTRGVIMMIFDGAKYYQRTGQRITEEGTYTLDATRSPHAIDLIAENGGDPGAPPTRLVPTLRRFVDDRTRESGRRSRPKNLEAKSGSGVVLVLKRYRP